MLCNIIGYSDVVQAIRTGLNVAVVPELFFFTPVNVLVVVLVKPMVKVAAIKRFHV